MTSVVVLGDIMADVKAMMADTFDTATASEGAAPGRVVVALGGTGVALARALVDQFEAVTLLGAVGTDHNGGWVHQLLDGEPFACKVTTKDGERTGMVLIVRDSPRPDVPHGRRVVVADAAANRAYDHNDVAAAADLIQGSDLLCVDGYGLLHEPRRTATLHAMRLARRMHRDVLVDLVPHDVFRHWSLREARQLVQDTTVLVSSGTTLAHLVGFPWPGMQPLDRNAALDVARQATAHLGERIYLVRFGLGHCSESIAVAGSTLLWHEHTDYPRLPADQVQGFGDLLTAADLRRLLKRPTPRQASA